MPTRDALTTIRRLAPRSVGSMEIADTIQSDNFVSSTSTGAQAGWQITRAGVSHFTEGFLGNLNVSGTLSLTSGGTLRTTTSTGATRWVFSGSTSVGAPDELQGFLGGEQNTPARFRVYRNTGGAQRGSVLNIRAGTIDSSTGLVFGPTQWTLESAGELAGAPGSFAQGQATLIVGTTTGGFNTVLGADATRLDLDRGLTYLRFPVKTDVGHPAGTPLDGDSYMNSAAPGFYIYEGGAWRTIATW